MSDKGAAPGSATTADAAALSELFGRAKDGDGEALARFVGQVTPLLWHVARQQGADRATCEDIVQTTWLRLFRAADTIRDPDAVIGWLVTVIRREAWRAVAAQRKLEPVDDADIAQLPSPMPGPESMTVTSEQHRVLWDAVSSLSPRCQDLLRLVAFVHRPRNVDVSRQLGLPVGSIGPTRGRCLARLRANLLADPRWSM